MKKSTLLSLLTTAAIITTTAGTYAVWDTVEDSTQATITFSQPVTVEVPTNYTLSENQTERTLGNYPSASGNVSFTIKNNNIVNGKKLANQLEITPSISGEGLGINDFTIEIIDKNDSNNPLNENNSNVFTDNTIDSTDYTVKVTPVNEKSIGKAVNVTLNATLK